MPNWGEVLTEINHLGETRDSPIDAVRRKYLKKLSDYTDRNIIAYYSGWLQKPSVAQVLINDDDKNGFMATIHGLDRSRGLDLILHTPGGDLAATESIVHYLRSMFNKNIRVIIPQMAMSAGTMIACSSKQIIMGKQSNIGPIDPQFNGFPAHGVLKEFETAIEKTGENPDSIPIWREIVSKYHPTFIGECYNAIELATEIVSKWLVSGMFDGEPGAEKQAFDIVAALNNHDDTKTHARHIHIEEAENIGLKIFRMEDDQDIQDLSLTVHHCYMHTFGSTQAFKIIENHKGDAIATSSI